MTVSGPVIAGVGDDCTRGVGEAEEVGGVGFEGRRTTTAATRPTITRRITITVVLFMVYPVCLQKYLFASTEYLSYTIIVVIGSL